MFCKHDYKLINEHEMKSRAEIGAELGFEINSSTDIFIRKYITDYTCSKCGKLKRFVVEN